MKEFKEIDVFAPASVANMGCGFDIMGMALDNVGDVLNIRISEGDGLQIINHSEVELPGELDKNVITPAVRALMEAYAKPLSITITIKEKIHPGSGIGSSAASSAAAVYGLNYLLGSPFDENRVVEFAMEGEKLISGGTAHADNVAPAIMGGVVLLRGYNPLEAIKLPVPADFHCAVCHPDIEVSTREARAILPKEIPLRQAVEQWGNVGGLVAGLALGDTRLVGRAMRDVVVEPYRKRFIPGFDSLREKVLRTGALAMNISGSGPSVFALSDSSEVARRVADIMEDHFAAMGIGSRKYVSEVARKGARIVEAASLSIEKPNNKIDSPLNQIEQDQHNHIEQDQHNHIEQDQLNSVNIVLKKVS